MAALPTDLTTLAAVNLALEITDGSADVILQQQISALSLDFMREINRPDFFPARDYTDLFLGNGSHRLYARHTPINSIASITYVDATVLTAGSGFVDGYMIEGDGVDPETRIAVVIRGSCFRRACLDIPNYSIVYNAGYTAVPPDVAQAIIQCVTATYKSGLFLAQQVTGSGQSVQIGDYQQSLSQSQFGSSGSAAYSGLAGVNDYVANVIAHYKRVSIG